MTAVAGFATRAHADPDPCVHAIADPAVRAMQVDLAPAAAEQFTYPILVAHAGSEFPAVSKDGKVIVELFEDSEDFTGAPSSTLVFWAKSGKIVDTFDLGGSRASNTPQAAADLVRARANARLARSTWRPLAVHDGCTPPGPDDADQVDAQVQLDGGLVLHYAPDTGRLSSQRAGHKAKRLRTTFGAPGTRMGQADEGGGKGCGHVTRIAYAFGGPALGLAIVVPEASLGGDSCFGLSGSATALAVRLP
jgi:hypothetical protein